MARDKKLIVGNWKMNLTTHEASLFLLSLSKLVKVRRDVEVVLAPSILSIQSLSLQIDRRQFKLAAQNMYWRDNGSFTGEVSATQLRGIVDYALVGHSERRHVFHETDKDTRSKVQAALRNQIYPILCIGETASERANGETNDALHDQLVGGLANVTSDELKDVIIAYEPVWAIGTGDNALPNDVKNAITAIRSQIKHLYGATASKEIRVLYGGSVKADSAADYLAVDGVDGLLIGGASLDAHSFNEIVKKAHKNAVDVKN
ncbi:MAG: triose-phosphate isomerase [Candidatus Saccharimonadales bacterium]